MVVVAAMADGPAASTVTALGTPVADGTVTVVGAANIRSVAGTGITANGRTATITSVKAASFPAVVSTANSDAVSLTSDLPQNAEGRGLRHDPFFCWFDLLDVSRLGLKDLD